MIYIMTGKKLCGGTYDIEEMGEGNQSEEKERGR